MITPTIHLLRNRNFIEMRCKLLNSILIFFLEVWSMIADFLIPIGNRIARFPGADLFTCNLLGFSCTAAMIQKVLSLKGHFGWAKSSREANRTAPKLFPFWKMTGKHAGVPNTVTAITWNKCTVSHVRTANIVYVLRSISESRIFARVTKVETVHDQIKDSGKTASGIANRPHRKNI